MVSPEVFERAADRIEAAGLWRGGRDPLREGPNATCAHLALFNAGGGTGATEVFAEHLGIDTSTCNFFTAVYAWNDWEGRTKEQVCKELRSCAANLRAVSDG